MSNFSKITNPLTNQTFSIFSVEGKKLLKNYLTKSKRKVYFISNGEFANSLGAFESDYN